MDAIDSPEMGDEFCMAQHGPSWPSDIFAAECSSAGNLGEIRPASRHAHGHGIRHPILTDHVGLTQVTSVDPWLDKARLQDVTGNLGKRAIGPIGGAFLPHEQLNLAVFIGLDGFFSTTSSSKETQKVGRWTNSSKQECNTPRFFQHLQLPTISAICSPYHGAKLLVQRQVHQHGAAQPLVVVFQVQHLDCHGCTSSSAHWNIWNRSCKLKHSTGGHQQQNHDADTLCFAEKCALAK